jgi:hypothetical protein
MATWQEKLTTYKTDQGAAIEEVLRAKQVYGEKQAAGDTAGMQAAERWANQVTAAAGLDDSLYGAGVTYDQALANYNASTQPVPLQDTSIQAQNTGAGTTGQTQNTGTATTGQLTPEQIAAQAYAAQLAQMQAQQQALAQAQRQSRIAALQKAKESALSGLEAEKATIDPYYYERRNEAAAQKDISDLNFAQYMASRGIKGAASGASQMYSNAALQAQIGKLAQQQAAEYADIARRRSGIESAYEFDVSKAMADIDSQTMQAYIDAMKTVQQQRIADLAAQGLTSTGQLTLAGREAQNAELERRAALLAAQYYDNIQAKINELAAANPNDPLIPYLYAARRQKITDQAEQAARAAAAASEAEKEAWNRAFKAFQEVGYITSAEQAQILGLPTDATVADVDIARMNAATSRINAIKSNTSTTNGVTGGYGTVSSTELKPYVNYINANYREGDTAGIRAYLIRMYDAGAPSYIIDALAAQYGITD